MAVVDSQLGLGQQPTLVQSQSGLRADGIGKSFNKRRVVRNVSIKLNRGEAVGLLGPNGAGKTTTFYMLAGLIPADEGSVFIDGQEVTALPIFQRARLGMGYLPQESSIFRGLTVEQNIRAVLETLDDSDDERFEELVGKVTKMSTKEYMTKYTTKFDEPYERAKKLNRAAGRFPIFHVICYNIINVILIPTHGPPV